MNRTACALLLFLVITLFFTSIIQDTSAQLSSLLNPSNVNQQYVTYQEQSNFFHEFNVPVHQRGLKGISTDSEGNPWFYHQTNKTSTIINYNLTNNNFRSFQVEGKTVTDNPVINLAGGQMTYDGKTNNIWFTDARIILLEVLIYKVVKLLSIEFQQTILE